MYDYKRCKIFPLHQTKTAFAKSWVDYAIYRNIFSRVRLRPAGHTQKKRHPDDAGVPFQV